MTSTLPAPTSPAAALDPATVLDAAADLLLTAGHARGGDFWRGVDWHGQPVTLAGAVAVVRGITTYRCAVGAWARDGVDPAVEALARHIGWRGDIEAALPGLWAWEDRTPTAHVVVALRRCAADLRAEAVCVTCKHPYPGHYESCPQIRPVRHHAAAVTR